MTTTTHGNAIFCDPAWTIWEADEGNTIQGVITQITHVLEEFKATGGVEEVGREGYLSVESVELFAAGSDNPFAPIACVYRCAVHRQIGVFDERVTVIGDWDFNLRLLARYEIGVSLTTIASTIYANTVTDA